METIKAKLAALKAAAIAKLTAIKTRVIDFLVGRMSIWMWISIPLALLSFAINPELISTTVYKVFAAVAGGWGGYVLDCHLFPYARPDGYLKSDNWKRDRDTLGKQKDAADFPVADDYHAVFAFAQIRRAVVVIGVAAVAALAV